MSRVVFLSLLCKLPKSYTHFCWKVSPQDKKFCWINKRMKYFLRCWFSKQQNMNGINFVVFYSIFQNEFLFIIEMKKQMQNFLAKWIFDRFWVLFTNYNFYLMSCLFLCWKEFIVEHRSMADTWISLWRFFQICLVVK